MSYDTVFNSQSVCNYSYGLPNGRQEFEDFVDDYRNPSPLNVPPKPPSRNSSLKDSVSVKNEEEKADGEPAYLKYFQANAPPKKIPLNKNNNGHDFPSVNGSTSSQLNGNGCQSGSFPNPMIVDNQSCAINSRPRNRKNYVPKERKLEEIFEEDLKNVCQNEKAVEKAEIDVFGTEILEPFGKWEDMNLDLQLLKNIHKSNYLQPKNIQKYTIPYIQNRFNVKCQSESGSGKTAAFLIPIIDNLIKDKKRSSFLNIHPICLIVAPTRELVTQIYEQTKKLANGTGITVACCYGQYSISQNLSDIRKGCNILIACLGRLLDFIKHGHLELKCIRYFVIDEIDKFMENKFEDFGILKLLNCSSLPSSDKRQTLLFSATLEDSDVERFANENIHYEKNVFILSKNKSNPRIKYEIMAVPSIPAKFRYLLNYLKEITEKNDGICPKVVIFVNRKIDVDRVAVEVTNAGFFATTIHSDRTQDLREEALDYFKKDKANILVATNVFERGVDIKDMDYVINFDIPQTRTIFLQRCGRTGRSRNGTALSFYFQENDYKMAQIIDEIIQNAGQESPEFLRFGVKETDYKYEKRNPVHKYPSSDHQIIISDNNVNGGW